MSNQLITSNPSNTNFVYSPEPLDHDHLLSNQLKKISILINECLDNKTDSKIILNKINASLLFLNYLKNHEREHEDTKVFCESILKEFGKYGISPVLVEFDQFKQSCIKHVKQACTQNNLLVTEDIKCIQSLYHLYLALPPISPDSAQIKFWNIPELLTLTMKSNIKLEKDYKDLNSLNVMSLVSKKSQNASDIVKKNWIVELFNTEKVVFSDFGIKTVDDFIHFSEYLGEKQCEKIINIKIPTVLLCENKFISSFPTYFKNIKHISFESVQIELRRERMNNDIGFSFLKKLPCLESLDFSEIPRVVQRLDFLEPLTGLKKLNLNASCLNVNEDFSVIKKLTNLTHLSITGRSINKNQIDFLKALTDLKKLKLFFSDDIKHLNVLKNKDNLTHLDVRSTSEGVKDLSFLNDLKNNLTTLKLNGISFIDSQFLSHMSHLTHLEINGCKNINPDYLKYLTNLTHIEFENCNLEIDFITYLTEIQSIITTQLCPIEHLSNLNHLQKLKVDVSDINGTKDFEKLINLKELCIIGGHNAINNIDALKSMTQLTKLRIEEARLDNLDFLDDLINLEHLSIIDCHLNLEGVVFPSLRNLLRLDLDQTKMGKISFTGPFPKLKILNAPRCSLANVEFLKSMENLEILNLNGNNMREIPFSSLNQLKELHLAWCCPININNIGLLSNLKKLILNNNHWFINLELLAGLSKLQSLDVRYCNELSSIDPPKSLKNLEYYLSPTYS